MGKGSSSKMGMEKGAPYAFPTRFGSHAKMVQEEASKAVLDPKFVILKDENGDYVTEKRNLDCGTADPYRNETPEFRQEFVAAAKTETDLNHWLTQRRQVKACKAKKPRRNSS